MATIVSTETKGTNTSFTTTTLANDPDLYVDLSVGEHKLEMLILYDGSAANDAKFEVNFSGSATVSGSAVYAKTGAALNTGSYGFTAFGTTFSRCGAGGVGYTLPVNINAVVNVTQSGRVRVQAAKYKNADTTPVRTLGGSYISVYTDSAVVTPPPPPPDPEPDPEPTYRDYFLQPYDEDSIWNTPIGDAVDAQPADLPVAYNLAGKVSIDEIFISFEVDAPIKTLTNGTRLDNKTMPVLAASSQVPAGTKCRIRDNLLHDSTWNGIAAMLHETDDTLAWTGQALYRPNSAANPQMYRTGPNYPTGIRGLDDLKGDGRKGAHGGGQCGGIGGTIRAWEYDAAIASNYKINHRLALNVDSKICLSQADQGFGAGLSGPGWRWPAYRADAEAFTPTGEGFYGRTGEGYDGMVMGSLLALPPGYDLSGIADPLVASIGWALKKFGCHIVDSTGTFPRYAFSCEANREAAWLARPISTFHQKLMPLITSLVLVDDCTPATPGGAGSPRTTPPDPLEP